MSTKKVEALSNFDGHPKGTQFDLPPKYAEDVIKKGLAKEVAEKAAPAPANKMAAEADNKAEDGRRIRKTQAE